MAEGGDQGGPSAEEPGQPVPLDILAAIQATAMMLAMEARLRVHVEEMVKEQVRRMMEPVIRDFENVLKKFLDS